MTNRDRLKELFKKTEYTPFPKMTMKLNLGNQFTEYALNCIVDEFIANGVIVPHCKVEDIEKIVLPDAIKSIDASAFEGCFKEVEDRHGKWIEHHGQSYLVSPMKYDEYGCPILQDYVWYECSECGRTESEKEPYCNCGAKMDGEKHEI